MRGRAVVADEDAIGGRGPCGVTGWTIKAHLIDKHYHHHDGVGRSHSTTQQAKKTITMRRPLLSVLHCYNYYENQTIVPQLVYNIKLSSSILFIFT